VFYHIYFCFTVFNRGIAPFFPRVARFFDAMRAISACGMDRLNLGIRDPQVRFT
jgi:hypothetical protein